MCKEKPHRALHTPNQEALRAQSSLHTQRKQKLATETPAPATAQAKQLLFEQLFEKLSLIVCVNESFQREKRSIVRRNTRFAGPCGAGMDTPAHP